MPRPGPRRTPISIRMSDEGIAHLDRMAKENGIERSELIRRMLAYANQHMPTGWQSPVKGQPP